jgi:hypothetical protein
MPIYEYCHGISLAETSLMGGVYYTNPIGWQGCCCWELFLAEQMPSVLSQLSQGLVF